MKATCTAHACYLRHAASNYETIPLIEPATVEPNYRTPHTLRLRFADGSVLTVESGGDQACSVDWKAPV